MESTEALLKFVKGSRPVIKRGKVVRLRFKRKGKVSLPEGVKGYLDEHPDGSDRGGYVPWLYLSNGNGVYYDLTEGEWF